MELGSHLGFGVGGIGSLVLYVAGALWYGTCSFLAEACGGRVTSIALLSLSGLVGILARVINRVWVVCAGEFYQRARFSLLWVCVCVCLFCWLVSSCSEP